MTSDAELLEAWRAGDPTAGRALFERHIGLLSRFFRNKAGDETEELIQRTFLACVESRDRVRDGAAFRTYLLRVARSKLYKHYASVRPQVELDAMSVSIADLQPSPSVVLAQRQHDRALLEALRCLPLELQLAIELHYWEGMSTAELAELLELPQGTVKTRLMRARERLREALAAALASGVPDDDEHLDAWARSLRALVVA
ncbi:MAG: sigma-70 family RNA polymerase sigma factor [Myxococcales bacterium]|nr:sigma-70 family RNA polymerase sigma factor [Myxococcales bacterium]